MVTAISTADEQNIRNRSEIYAHPTPHPTHKTSKTTKSHGVGKILILVNRARSFLLGNHVGNHHVGCFPDLTGDLRDNVGDVIDFLRLLAFLRWHCQWPRLTFCRIALLRFGNSIRIAWIKVFPNCFTWERPLNGNAHLS